ncbi:hypothetical protein [Brevundimonas sp.]|uniref:hypothetical protein n=1 Tax=Brevundimonas sp. TaxID=1871086 RepID=UPI0002A24081|nr:hypothetical protein [Brevundimonas sp.]EKY29699.1 hypothetical protein HMPREF0185_01039 [Brevundimonas diminuta 470-4]
MLNQTYFEMADVPASASRTWIPLRENSDVDLDTPADLISASLFTGVATLAVYAGQTENAGRLDWSDLNLQPHRAHVWTDGYHPADIYQDNRFEEPLGINLVIDQDLEGAADGVWHLHPDVVLALRLSRDGDTWFRPEEGWVEVIRLIREDDRPVRLEIRAEFLADYLAARSMKLYLSSYHERIVVTPSAPTFSWPEEGFALEKGRDTHEGRIATQRNLGVPGEGSRVAGALWRTEWFEPGDFSPRVRGDPDPHPIAFASGPRGDRVPPDRLQRGIDWLYFEPSLASHLLRHRGSRLRWASAETGVLGAAEAPLHFGVNAKGLINVFAKDVGRLQTWEQRIWAAHSVAVDGPVSAELFQAQMMVDPADTIAPEHALPAVIRSLDDTFREAFGPPLLRPHASVETLLTRSHRFRAAEPDGLLALAKDLTRVFIERVDVTAVRNAAVSRGQVLGDVKALKALEGLAASRVGEPQARALMGPLFGLYDLRLADAHLGSDVSSALERLSIDAATPATVQGRVMLESVVGAIDALTKALIAPPDVNTQGETAPS